MPNHDCRLVAVAARLCVLALTLTGSVSSPAWSQATAPTVTVGDLTRSKPAPAPPARAPVLQIQKPQPSQAQVRLDAVYGTNGQLRFDAALNGAIHPGVKAGEVLRSGGAACRIGAYLPVERCITLDPAAKSSEICPAMACWTGQRPPPAAPTDQIGRMPPSALPLASMPPLPIVPAPAVGLPAPVPGTPRSQ
jgi:hypothetical protein